METKINIAEILKDKPKGIRLYSPIFGECAFSFVREETDEICVKKHNGEKAFFNSKGLYNILGECLLSPSRNMRDWSKFLWKKGDILVSNDSDSHIIFEGFSKDNYTTFEGKHWISVSKKRYIFYLGAQNTQSYHIEDDKDAAQTYINAIEKRLGGKLNLETLEIEKQPEFKDGDIVTAVFTDGDEMICVFKEKIEQDYMGYCGFFSKRKHKGDVFMDFGDDCIYNNSPICKEIRLASEEEKQQLFDALAKKGKAWDAEKKEVVDLKPKIELKPFDKVLVRNNEYQNWRVNLFGFIDDNGYYNCAYSKWAQCIPYEGNEHLLGTTDDWEG